MDTLQLKVMQLQMILQKQTSKLKKVESTRAEERHTSALSNIQGNHIILETGRQIKLQ